MGVYYINVRAKEFPVDVCTKAAGEVKLLGV